MGQHRDELRGDADSRYRQNGTMPECLYHTISTVRQNGTTQVRTPPTKRGPTKPGGHIPWATTRVDVMSESVPAWTRMDTTGGVWAEA